MFTRFAPRILSWHPRASNNARVQNGYYLPFCSEDGGVSFLSLLKDQEGGVNTSDGMNRFGQASPKLRPRSWSGSNVPPPINEVDSNDSDDKPMDTTQQAAEFQSNFHQSR